LRKIIATAAMLIAALFLTGLFAAPVSAAADAPDYDRSSAWGVGQELSLDWTWDDMPNDVKYGLGLMLAELGMEIDDLGLSADAAFYAMLKVTDVSDDEYVMSAKMAIKLAADANVAITGDLPKAGSYNVTVENFLTLDYEELGIPVEQKTVSLDLSTEFALIFEGTLHLQKEDLAIKNMELSLAAAAVISFDAKNLPAIETEYIINDDWSTNLLVDASYENYDVDVKAVFDAKFNVAFSPALNIYEFPMEEGNTWTIDSEATLTGEMNGFLDVKGLPEDMEDELFGSDYFEELNITGFPINFDDFDLGELQVKDGKLETVVQQITAEVLCTSEDDGVYTIEADVNGKTIEYTYNEELIELFASLTMNFEDMPIDLSVLEDMGIEFEKKDVTAAQAEAEIESIKSYQTSVANKAKGVSDFPILLVAAIAGVLAVVVVAAVLIVRKRK